MDLYPAIDLRGGSCVRLYQGDYDNETVYGDDPVDQALQFQDAGANWIHVVDLDAARSGVGTNRDSIEKICAAVHVPVQCGGGVRTQANATELAELGVARVVMGTAAIETPELVEEIASHQSVAVGLDARGKELAGHGWEVESTSNLIEVARRFSVSDVDAFVVTEISVDGTLEGPSFEQLADVLRVTAGAVDVIASGGVGTLDHVVQLLGLTTFDRSLSGVIMGKALYENAFTLQQARAAVDERNESSESQ